MRKRALVGQQVIIQGSTYRGLNCPHWPQRASLGTLFTVQESPWAPTHLLARESPWVPTSRPGRAPGHPPHGQGEPLGTHLTAPAASGSKGSEISHSRMLCWSAVRHQGCSSLSSSPPRRPPRALGWVPRGAQAPISPLLCMKPMHTSFGLGSVSGHELDPIR